MITPAAHGEEWEILNEEVISLYEKGEYARATKVAKKALKVAEETLGENHPDVATTLNNLAELYKTQGDYEGGVAVISPLLANTRRKTGQKPP